MAKSSNFQPDWTSPPGETIADILEERNLSRIEFARRIGGTLDQATELINGSAMITKETAQRLEAALGGSAAFWLARESQHRDDVARLARRAPATSDSAWLSELPVKDMIRFGWLQPAPNRAASVTACLDFFGVTDVSAWQDKYAGALQTSAFRTSPSFASHPGAVLTWLRQGEIQAGSINCGHWDAKRFEEMLPTIRSLTRRKEPSAFLPELTRRCAECGVAIVIVRAPTGCRASGSTRFLSPTQALLLLSFRYLSDDQFWFTFFHEAGHLVLHGENALFLEGAPSLTKEEEEANQFSAGMLIPPALQGALLKLPLNARAVIKFARLAGVSPGVVVGQLQYFQRIKQNQLNGLKRRFTWTDD